MNTTRRTFLSGTAALLGAATLSAVETPRREPMNIVVLTGSPRRRGNSNTLAERFIQGAQEAGHTVFRFDCAAERVRPCQACNACGMNGPCVQKDAFEKLREPLIKADLIALVTPMYYFGISAQLKTVIDRFYAINGPLHVSKKAVLMMTYANSNPNEAKPIIAHYEQLCEYMGWTDVGQIIVPGVWPVGAINHTDAPNRAYTLGKSL